MVLGVVSRFLLYASLSVIAAQFACGQITNVTDDQSTPIPGVGHDYIHMLAETANPANGSLSVRIQVPLPKSRGLTIPFAFAYDSDGAQHLESFVPGITNWVSNAGFLSQGGWTYTLPILSERMASRNIQMAPNIMFASTLRTTFFRTPQAVATRWVWPLSIIRRARDARWSAQDSIPS